MLDWWDRDKRKLYGQDVGQSSMRGVLQDS